MKVLFTGLEKIGRTDLNVIIVSDHGMIGLDPLKVVRLDEIIDINLVDVVDWSPVVMLWPKSDAGILILGGFCTQSLDTAKIYQTLLEASRNSSFTVYERSNVLERFHYRNNKRISPILVIADQVSGFFKPKSYLYYDARS